MTSRDWYYFDMGEVSVSSRYLGRWYWLDGSRWYWLDGNLALAHDGALEAPTTNTAFILEGNICRVAYDGNTMNTKSVMIDFSEPLELAMKLSNYNLVNADHVIRKIKEIINATGI